MAIVPVATVQVGCAVTVAVGAAGVAGCAFTVTLVTEDVQPLLFLAVRLYEPAAIPLNTPVVLV
jgi:hypothetical protein